MNKKNNIQRELDQKEFENDIEQQLRSQELDHAYNEKLDSDYHPVALGVFNFLMNLTIGYIIYKIFLWFGGGVIGMFSPEIGIGIQTIFNILIVGVALIAAITKKSPWDKIFRG
jgi:hypothetical protein